MIFLDVGWLRPSGSRPRPRFSALAPVTAAKSQFCPWFDPSGPCLWARVDPWRTANSHSSKWLQGKWACLAQHSYSRSKITSAVWLPVMYSSTQVLIFT